MGLACGASQICQHALPEGCVILIEPILVTQPSTSPSPGNDRIRVLSNYTRLLASFMLGLVLARVLLRLGTDAYGLIIFLGAGTGIIGSLRETVAVSMVPELGAAYHDADPRRFQSSYSSAFLLSAILALLSLVIVIVIGFCLPFCNIPPSMLTAARWFLVAKAAQALITVFFSPASNMFLVTERMISYNLWTIAEKVGDTLAAAIILITFADRSATQLVIMYGTISAALGATMVLASTVQISLTDRRLVARQQFVSRGALSELMHSFGWNSGVTLAINLYTRMTALVMNLTFGLFGNVVFGIAVQVCMNLRQLSMGLVTGIDAVAARLNSHRGEQAIRELCVTATRLQGLVVLPGICWLMLYVDSFIMVWVGSRLEDPAKMISVIGSVSRLLLLGVGARSLSEGWMRILSGAGHAKKYAPVVLACGLVNPLLAFVFVKTTSGAVQFAAPTVALSLLMIAVHGVALPWIVARHLGLPVRRIVAPLARPFVAAVISAVITRAFCPTPVQATTAATAWSLGLTTGVFCLLYLVLAIAIATSSHERLRFIRWLGERSVVEHPTIDSQQPTPLGANPQLAPKYRRTKKASLRR